MVSATKPLVDVVQGLSNQVPKMMSFFTAGSWENDIFGWHLKQILGLSYFLRDLEGPGQHLLMVLLAITFSYLSWKTMVNYDKNLNFFHTFTQIAEQKKTRQMPLPNLKLSKWWDMIWKKIDFSKNCDLYYAKRKYCVKLTHFLAAENADSQRYC